MKSPTQALSVAIAALVVTATSVFAQPVNPLTGAMEAAFGYNSAVRPIAGASSAARPISWGNGITPSMAGAWLASPQTQWYTDSEQKNYWVYNYIVDAKHGRAPVAGNVYDGRVYHQDPQARLNAQWRFVDAGNGYFYIIDRGHGKALVAGDVYDGRIYHQDPNNRANAQWRLVPATANTSYIVDRKHGKALVAGDNYDGNVYHQDPNGRANAQWIIAVQQDPIMTFGVPGF